MAISNSTLIVSGYKNEAPGPIAAEIDERVCRESTCHKCGHEGMSYQPWHKPGSYIAIAQCPNPKCKHREEF